MQYQIHVHILLCSYNKNSYIFINQNYIINGQVMYVTKSIDILNKNTQV